MPKIVFFFTALICCFSAFGQAQPDSLRDLRIKRYPDFFSVWPAFKQRTLTFQVAKNDQRGNKIDYTPNNAFALGAGAYVFDLAVELTFAIPLNEKSYALYGKSKARDLQINALNSKWGADVYYQKYGGFYVDDPKIDHPKGVAYPQRSDIQTRNFGVSGLYIFSDKKFSFKSALMFGERQLRSGGSLLLTGTLNSFKLHADSAVLAPSYQTLFGAGASFNRLQYTTFSIVPGYAYNVVYHNFFFNIGLMIGPAHNWITHQTVNQPEKNDITFSAFTVYRVGLGYSGDRFFAGINFISRSRAVPFDNIYFANSSNTFRFLVGYRFRETGPLKNSVWQLSKKLLQDLF